MVLNMTRAFVYKWTELSTGKWYIGSRTAKNCHPDDGYICSSKSVKPMIKANPENWERSVLCIGHSRDMYELECKLLTSLDAAADEMSYNKSNGGLNFGNTGKTFTRTEEFRRRMSQIQKGVTKTSEHRKKISETRKKRKIPSPNKGKKLSEERKAHLATVDKSYTQTAEYRANMSKVKTGSGNGRYKGPTIATNMETGEEIIMHGQKDMEAHGFSQSMVSKCLAGRYSQHKGFTFKRIVKE